MKFRDVKKVVASEGGKFYKLQDGPNRLRIVSEPLQLWKVFDGKNTVTITNADELEAYKGRDPKMRFAMWIIDRVSNEIRLAEFGPSIMGQLGDLQENPEYAFDDLPPYDLIVTKSGSGMETEYKVVAARQNTVLTVQEEAKIKALPSVEAEYDVKPSAPKTQFGAEPINTDDIPF